MPSCLHNVFLFIHPLELLYVVFAGSSIVTVHSFGVGLTVLQALKAKQDTISDKFIYFTIKPL